MRYTLLILFGIAFMTTGCHLKTNGDLQIDINLEESNQADL